jgi:sugar-phosphatase
LRQLMCEGVLFDLDGVLVDSSASIQRTWKKWADLHGIDLTSVMRSSYGVRTVETMRLLVPHLDAEREAAQLTAAEIADTEGVTATDGALALLQNLPPDRWAIVTSGSRQLAVARLETAGLPVPEVLVSGDQVQRGKPAPDPYLEGARRLGRPPEACLVVEDAPAGIASARAAGMQVVGVASTHPRRDLDTPFVVGSLAELGTHLDSEGEPRLRVTLPPE